MIENKDAEINYLRRREAKVRERLLSAIWWTLLICAPIYPDSISGLQRLDKINSSVQDFFAAIGVIHLTSDIGFFRFMTLMILLYIGAYIVTSFIMNADAPKREMLKFAWKFSGIIVGGYLLANYGFLVSLAFFILWGIISTIFRRFKFWQVVPAAEKGLVFKNEK